MVAEIGRVCFKTVGRESGNRCVIVELIDDSFVLVDGPGVKRRRCNLKHLEPSENKVEISRGASTEEVERALKEIGSKEPKEPPKRKKTKPKENVEEGTENKQESEKG